MTTTSDRKLLPVLNNHETRESPDWVRISTASALALRYRSGKFTRDFDFGGINLLLNYGSGCRSDCSAERICSICPSSSTRRRSLGRATVPVNANRPDAASHPRRHVPEVKKK